MGQTHLRRSSFFDFRPHRWAGKLGSGNDEWFFLPLRLGVLLGIVYLFIRSWTH
jgi:hypothetical protein